MLRKKGWSKQLFNPKGPRSEKRAGLGSMDLLPRVLRRSFETLPLIDRGMIENRAR
jgi:hypothetical protein